MNTTLADTPPVWPAGVVIRFATLCGATVDITRTETGADIGFAAACTGCLDTHTATARCDYQADGPALPPTTHSIAAARRRVCAWAQEHAERCRALPCPDGGAPC